MARTAVGYFRDRDSADGAYDELVRRGFSRDDISVLGRGAEGKAGQQQGEGHDVGAGEGAAVGGIAGLLLGVAAMLIPGIGPIVAVGPITAALAGAVTGGVTGTVVGGITAALVHTGVEEEEARYYDQRFREGGVLLTVRTGDDRHDEAREILERHGADVRGGGAAGPSTGDVDRGRDAGSDRVVVTPTTGTEPSRPGVSGEVPGGRATGTPETVSTQGPAPRVSEQPRTADTPAASQAAPEDHPAPRAPDAPPSVSPPAPGTVTRTTRVTETTETIHPPDRPGT